MHVANYSRKINSRQSYTFERRKKMRALLTAGIVLVISITWTITFSRLSYLSSLQINFIKIEGIKDENSVLSASIYDAISGSYIGLFSKSNKYLYPKKEIINKIKNLLPQVESVSINWDRNKTLNVSISEKTPSSIVCPYLPDFNDDSDQRHNQCYFADMKGYIYDKSPDFSGLVYKKIYLPDISLPTATSSLVGSYATSTTIFKDIISFLKTIEDNSLIPEGLLVKSDGELEVYVYNPKIVEDIGTTTSQSIAVIYFGKEVSLYEQLTNLVSFWNSMVSSAKNKKKDLSFEYIDLRHGNHIYYTLTK